MFDNIKFNEDGLIPAIAQQYNSGEILMMAWMNKQSIEESLKTNNACYYSRSRKKLWHKGQTSGQIQILKEIRLDCDGDTILLIVDQTGVACHTGTRSCFNLSLKNNKWESNQKQLISPDELYKK